MGDKLGEKIVFTSPQFPLAFRRLKENHGKEISEEMGHTSIHLGARGVWVATLEGAMSAVRAINPRPRIPA